MTLTGSPVTAAATSFFLFAVGACIPVLPFSFLSGMPAIVLCLAVSAIGLFGLGALITVFTGQSALVSGTRQLLLGGLAAGLTHLVGRAFATL